MLVGVGVAGALASRKPRSKLQRQTLEQLDLTIALLQGRAKEPPERTVHEARKALKRARALVRLQRDALGRKRFRRENATLRDAGRRLAGTRDAEVVLDALDALVRENRERLAGSDAVRELRARLFAERERAWAQMRQGAQTRELALMELGAARVRFERWQPAGSDPARAGLERIYRQGRKRHRRARRARGGTALHDWRKRVKDLRYAAEALKLRGVAAQADRIGEAIGEEHDLMLLAERVRAHRDCFHGEETTRKAMQKLIRSRRKQLRTQALELGERLHRRKPKRFARLALDG